MTGPIDAQPESLDHAALVARVRELGRALADEQSRTRELRAAVEQSKAREERKDLFVGLLSHALRAPLSAIKGHVRLVEEVVDPCEVTDDLREFLGALTGSAARLEALADELRSCARLKAVLERKEVLVPTLVRLLGQELQPAIEAREVHLDVEVKSDFRTIRADGERLRDALTQLVLHAVRHTPRGGVVRLSCADEGEWVKIWVADEGPPLVIDEPDALFQPFAPPWRRRDGESTDGELDLAIARRIAEAHGGGITVQRQASRGITFVLRLPRSFEDIRAMVADMRYDGGTRFERVADALRETGTRVLAHARDLSSRLSRETQRAERLEAALADMEETYLQTIAALADATDEKDAYSLGHTERVSFYARCIAAEISAALIDQRAFKYSLLLHDLGKIGIAEELLKKAGRLSETEWETVKSHSEIGARLLSKVRFLGPALASVRSHHERFDGKGYPDGLRGEQIPLPARIIAVADAFEAMTSDRPYRAGLSSEEARDQIVANAGTQFDPEVVAAFQRAWSPIAARARAGESVADSA